MQAKGLEQVKKCGQGGYYLDWLVAAVVIVITKVVIQDEVKYVDRHFSEDDPSLSYPDTDNSVPVWVLYLVVTVGPMVIFLLYQFFQPWSLIDLHHACLSIAEGFTIASLVTISLSRLGRYRPYWLTVGDDTEDGDRESYPSGYAAYSFSSMTVTSLYLIGKLKLYYKPVPGQFALFLVCNLPVAVAVYIAASRAADYKHAFSDINAGSFIGIVSGVVAYFLQYNWLFGETSGQPKLREEPVETEAAAPPIPEGSAVAITVAAPTDKEPAK